MLFRVKKIRLLDSIYIFVSSTLKTFAVMAASCLDPDPDGDVLLVLEEQEGDALQKGTFGFI